MINDEIKAVLACLICGVLKRAAKFPDCGQEAKSAGIKLADVPGIKRYQHIWAEALMVRNYFGIGLTEAIKRYKI